MTPLTEEQILEILADGSRLILGGPPRDIYFDLQRRGLIVMREIEINSQETGIKVSLAPKEDSA